MRMLSTGYAGVLIISLSVQYPDSCYVKYTEQVAVAMARFPEAEKRLLEVRICLKCNARNALKATKCRKCRYKGLRLKNKESKSL